MMKTEGWNHVFTFSFQGIGNKSGSKVFWRYPLSRSSLQSIVMVSESRAKIPGTEGTAKVKIAIISNC